MQFSAQCLEKSLEALAYVPVHFGCSKPNTGVRQQKRLAVRTQSMNEL